MAIIVLLIGVVLIVAAVRNSQGDLFNALGTDVPEFIVWAAAIFALGAIGFIPALKPVSRGLLALVLVAIILQNYQAILKGFQTAWSTSSQQSSSSQTSSSPSTSSVANDNVGGLNLSNLSSAFQTGSSALGSTSSFGGLASGG